MQADTKTAFVNKDDDNIIKFFSNFFARLYMYIINTELNIDCIVNSSLLAFLFDRDSSMSLQQPTGEDSIH